MFTVNFYCLFHFIYSLYILSTSLALAMLTHVSHVNKALELNLIERERMGREGEREREGESESEREGERATDIHRDRDRTTERDRESAVLAALI